MSVKPLSSRSSVTDDLQEQRFFTTRKFPTPKELTAQDPIEVLVELENAAAFIDAVRKARPTGAKGQYIKKITISSTMGAGVFVEDAAS